MTQKKTKLINLALQGGGAHGAFTWGVLDQLLEDGRLHFECISATSAGSLNAAVMMSGMVKGGPDAARENLDNFWQRVSEAGNPFNPIKDNPINDMIAANPFLGELNRSMAFQAMENFTHIASPYQFNPFNVNPLRDIVEDLVDIEAVHACPKTHIFVTATNVRQGTQKVFRKEEVTIDALMASAALPFLFKAVEIDGEAYWDGGYMGNPALWPIYDRAESSDILIVHINPIVRDKVPHTPVEIDNRLNEITFNSSLLNELRAVAFVQKLLRSGMLKQEHRHKYKDILLHAIRTDTLLNELAVSTKYDTDWDVLVKLKKLGRKSAKTWLTKNYASVNKHGTVDIREDYLYSPFEQ
jgi:NTE family protein